MLLHDGDTDTAAGATVVATDTDAEAVRAAVWALTPLDREALVLRVDGRRSLEEIAEHTRTTTAMVRVRIHRGAVAVQDAVGPAHPSLRHPAVTDAERAVVDAEMGITPALTARLQRALTRDVETRPSPISRRWRELVETLRR